MQGFKSFADPVTIELDNGITCIVGPNGSGKSNISDALRWVLGEQSPKQLRGSKMDEVIFAGTATRKPKGMAEVTLVIDNSTGILPLEYNEVAVTRRMFRSGESEYLINGNQCRLRDIKELFMDTGIGVDGYSIIGQGKIQEIVGTKPENRREIFEEAAGIVMYKNRKAEAERKLASASDNLERVRDIIAEIEDRIGGLKEESEKATEYIGLRDRYKSLEVNIILHNISGVERVLEAGKAELESLVKEYNDKVAENEQLEELIEKQRVDEAALNEEFEVSNAELLAKIEELHTISNRGQVNSERLASIEKDLARLAEVISTSEAKLAAEKASFDELTSSNDALEAEYAETKAKLKEATFKLNDHTTKRSLVDNEIDNLKDRIIDLNNKSVAGQAEINTLSTYRETLRDRAVTMQQEYEGHDETDARNKARLEEISREFNSKEAEVASVKAEIEAVEDKIISVNHKISGISSRIEEVTIISNRALARKNTIEEMENNYDGYNTAVKALMQRNFRGIIGTVSDLIKVPAGFEVAIETALGAAMQNIVCEDDNSAKQAVEWLKSARAGRATFLPVTSIRPGVSKLNSDVASMNGYLGIASEKITADSKYDNVVDYLLCRVILADNMDNAVKISKKAASGFRIVTLEGEVINSSGSITGGKYKNKTANILERKKEIDDLGKKVEALKNEVAKLNESRADGQKELQTLKSNRNDLFAKLQKLDVEINVLRSNRDHAKELVESASDAADKFALELKTLEEDIERATALIEKHQNNIGSYADEVVTTENKLDELMSDSLRYRNLVEEDNEAIVALKVTLSEQDTKILGSNELIERVRDTMTDIENELEDAVTENDELCKQRLLLTNTGAESDEKEAVLKEEKTALEEKINSISAALDDNRAKHELALRDQKNASKAIARIQDDKYKLEVKIARNEAVLDSQKNKLWDEFEISYAEALDLKDESFAITSGNKEAKEIRVRMAELGDVNISSIEEYKSVSKRYEFMTAQEADITKAMKELESIIRNMDKTIKEKFKENFDQIVIHFENTFRELFGGGHAELRLEDEDDPLTSGIEIIAQPPGKKLKNINLMSGGEKTLTAIALMFAVLKTKPTPFCILDEVEAALDEANIERFSQYLKNFREIQFAIITHQKVTMEHADVLYGVTMPEQGISRMLSLNLGDGVEV